MRYILIGRGKMGRLIQETAQAAGDEIEAAFGRDDLDLPWEKTDRVDAPASLRTK